MNKREVKDLAVGVGFLAPNILGVICFTMIPLVMSVIMAFSDWDLTKHNMFLDNELKFVGIDNFTKLFETGDFVRYLGNTLFFMIGIPLGMGGSLLAAILLSQEVKGSSRQVWGSVFASFIFILSICLLVLLGLGQSAMIILIVGIVGLIAVIGMTTGVNGYRTLFYTPHFTAGVATYILWKKMYNKESGVINNAIRDPLMSFAEFNQALSPSVMQGAAVLLGLVFALIIYKVSTHWGQMWIDGELGTMAWIICNAFVFIPVITSYFWSPLGFTKWIIAALGAFLLIVNFIRYFTKGRDFNCDSFAGAELAIVFALIILGILFLLVGLSAVTFNLPAMTQDGVLLPPDWLFEYSWAKPALMIMGLWGAIGSNNMLLYLAALTNVPQSLYEAADIDGANAVQKFWNVTWPSLAPTTFFIFVMSTIGGLQGGMEMAKTMTGGGPGGATTTLAYFIYVEGFETGRLGYSAAISWTLFALVFTVTMINWKFGNKQGE
ncbi:MAG: sugar ABC transporter permease [Lentisphaeria bacterium]|nr:sugar ABC transporter permease [Lentisphaeria bacterium]